MGKYDIALRHITRRHPEDLARALLPPGLAFEVVGWLDTQVTALERRLDRALDLRVAGERRALHVEIEVDMDADDAYRVYAYNARLVMALRDEAAKAPPTGTEGAPSASRAQPRAPVPVHSVVILLRGRKEPWPEQGEFATGWPEVPFSGARFHVEAVYQRTVAELRARGTLLWLVFTPLATDASAASMREVLAEMRSRIPQAEERADLFAVFLVMAEVDPWGHNLKEEIKAMMQAEDREIFKLSPTFREVFDEGQQRILSQMFVEQTGRDPTPEEQEALARRAREPEQKEAIRALMKLHGDALVAWLLGTGGAPEPTG